MKKVNNSIALLLLAFVSLIPLNANAQKKLANSLLWEISGKGIEPSYLMGTIHLLPQEDFILKEKVTKALGASDQIVMELDMDDPAMMGQMMQMMTIADGKTLKDFMTTEEYEFLDKELSSSFGQGLSAFGKMKPLAILSMVTLKLMGEQPASFERTFIAMAKEQNKEIYGLETVEDQMQVFEDIPYESQLDDIIEMLQDGDATQEYYDQMIDTYKAEDLNALIKMLNEYYENPEEAKILLDNRNIKWTPKIAEYAKDKSTFFAVGAGHLPGDNGVIKLLKKAGYKVKPVKG